MRVEVHLDKDDIKRIVADHFGVQPGDVDIHCFMETVGYGPGERDVPSVRAIVKTDGD